MLTYEKPKPVFSVNDYIEYINLILIKTDRVKIFGEITSVQNHNSGLFFTLKDTKTDSSVNCYIQPQNSRKFLSSIIPGLLVILEGNGQLFKRSGRFNFLVSGIEMAGEGVLKQQYERLCRQLQNEGLFTRKRTILTPCRRLAVITSATGAVIHDFKKNLATRGYRIYLFPVRVEGPLALKPITQALAYISQHSNQYDICVIIRGGGSLENLAAFNTESLSRAVFASPVPTLTGIGHELDIPLVSLVADVSVSTPTAAAIYLNQLWENVENEMFTLREIISNRYSQDLQKKILEFEKHQYNILSFMQSGKKQLAYIQQKLSLYLLAMSGMAHQQQLTIQFFQKYILEKFNIQFLEYYNQTHQFEKSISEFNPVNRLMAGYSIVKTETGKIVKSITGLNPEQIIKIRLSNGLLAAKITKIYENEATDF